MKIRFVESAENRVLGSAGEGMAEPLADVIAPSPRNNTSDKTPGPNLSIIMEKHRRHNPTKVLAATACAIRIGVRSDHFFFVILILLAE